MWRKDKFQSISLHKFFIFRLEGKTNLPSTSNIHLQRGSIYIITYIIKHIKNFTTPKSNLWSSQFRRVIICLRFNYHSLYIFLKITCIFFKFTIRSCNKKLRQKKDKKAPIWMSENLCLSLYLIYLFIYKNIVNFFSLCEM